MFCYRHPDREAYVRCQRCERFVCPDCQVASSVGVLCPECAGGTQSKITRMRNRSFASTSVTMTLIVINVLAYLVEISPFGTAFLQQVVLMPAFVPHAPWTLITSGFVHDWSSPLHLAVNMYSLYIFGQGVEPLLGKARYLALYMIALFAGAVGVLWLGDPTGITVGASGAIFGLMGGYFIFLRSLGQPSGQMFFLIAINLAFGFFASGISWEGHIGGLLGGIAVAGIYAQTRRPQDQKVQMAALIGLSVLLIVLAVVRVMALS